MTDTHTPACAEARQEWESAWNSRPTAYVALQRAYEREARKCGCLEGGK